MNNNKCLKCKHLDTSDMPNLFCKLSNRLVNDGDFSFCPLDSKGVCEYIENLIFKINRRLRNFDKWHDEIEIKGELYIYLTDVKQLVQDLRDIINDKVWQF